MQKECHASCNPRCFNMTVEPMPRYRHAAYIRSATVLSVEQFEESLRLISILAFYKPENLSTKKNTHLPFERAASQENLRICAYCKNVFLTSFSAHYIKR